MTGCRPPSARPTSRTRCASRAPARSPSAPSPSTRPPRLGARRPRAVLARRDGLAWLTTIGEELLDPVLPLDDPGRIRYGDGSLTAPEWEHAVARAVGLIRSGRLQKAVLARDLTAVAERPIDVRLLLSRLAERFPECYTFSCAGLVGATPELLVRHTGEMIESLVLAGTAPRAPTRPTTSPAGPPCSPRRRTGRSTSARWSRSASPSPSAPS
nr:hypothetical protein GCM10020093_016210 [Planobispora longispora]